MGGGGGLEGGSGTGKRIQPCKPHCCHMKSLNKTETPVFVLYVFFLSKATFIDCIKLK